MFNGLQMILNARKSEEHMTGPDNADSIYERLIGNYCDDIASRHACTSLCTEVFGSLYGHSMKET